jgi:hypothetical protein
MCSPRPRASDGLLGRAVAVCELVSADRRRATIHIPTPTTVTAVVKIAASLTSSGTRFVMIERVSIVRATR